MLLSVLIVGDVGVVGKSCNMSIIVEVYVGRRYIAVQLALGVSLMHAEEDHGKEFYQLLLAHRLVFVPPSFYLFF